VAKIEGGNHWVRYRQIRSWKERFTGTYILVRPCLPIDEEVFGERPTEMSWKAFREKGAVESPLEVRENNVAR